MSIQYDVFMALLSLDSYNRGYRQYVTVAGSELGTATVVSAPPEPEHITKSFFAQVYTWGDQTIISYRGTDDNVIDVNTGWILGAGDPSAEQAKLAFEFYKDLFGLNSSENVVLTGHSLGGGLAGFVGALVGKSAVIFDNMAFEAAVNTLNTSTLPIFANQRGQFWDGNTSPRQPVSFPNPYIHGYSLAGEELEQALNWGQPPFIA